jgi:hypothetical protein
VRVVLDRLLIGQRPECGVGVRLGAELDAQFPTLA